MQIDQIWVRKRGSLIPVPVMAIQYISVVNQHCMIHAGEFTLQVRYNLGTLQEWLPNDVFFRVHRKYVVNAKFVTTLRRNSVNIGEMQFPLSRANRRRLFEVLSQNRIGRRRRKASKPGLGA
ncbi:LytR/AlgR family response regulator transcription factor [Flavihumibacter petaseus]|nr:LytTR family DNA-binding domain-containing protein [Flavihumibacter petaseus]